MLYHIILATLFAFSAIKYVSGRNRNNMCNTYSDYYRIANSKNCAYSPDMFATLPQILSRYVGKFEEYFVTTDDGYILSIYRIPPKETPKGVIVFQHPLNADAEIWVSQGTESLAFNFSNSGYDVWLPSNRGTPNSFGHVNLTKDDPKYWDHSFHEIGLYDYPAITNFIKQKIGSSKMIFVGHSMSTTASLIFAMLRPDVAEKNIDIFFQMTPVAYMKHVPYRIAWQFCPLVVNMMNSAGIVSLFSDQTLSRAILDTLINFPNKRMIIETIAFVSGWTPDEFDVKFINVGLSHALKPFSTKTLLHYCQMTLNGGNFRMFDYGIRKNMEKYGSIFPPEYPVNKISVPTYLMSGHEDNLAGSKDADILFKRLPAKAAKYGQLKLSGMNHVDFQFGKHRYEKVFDVMWSVIKRMQSGT